MNTHLIGVTGALLAGGQGRRMDGRDKGLVEIAGRAMIEYAIDRLRPQVDELVIVANRNAATYRAFGHRVLADELTGYAGPLAGIAAAICDCTSPYLVVAPCDSPFLPRDLVTRLAAEMVAANAEISVASSAGRMQPVFAMLRVELRGSLHDYLQAGGRKIDTWYTGHRLAVVDFGTAVDAFMNINTPQEHAAAELRLRA